jgi:hypothetical protein
MTPVETEWRAARDSNPRTARSVGWWRLLTSLATIPDHEPALAADRRFWVPSAASIGRALARWTAMP